jgi:hypothetical protein|uniref:AC transposase, putative, expressed n=1 Tax=Oryza sativa subsp. japonica TaxID=39947 RepID=Q10JD3_ORYSJ|nr:zinc finger BED domain-containing protein RICESLEEPER 2-like [Oryza sativa Japonica Group]ABF96699.1 AC transposase, putative, expressed [Oryza sativa Japonica Group]ABF96700.1 AC transposase, putative, expressed [Oryza sativa Japonica Group]BAG95271.1 unnamed protein product [Oryza sativa Japonica Group]
MIVLQELPSSFVEHLGFRRFCASLNPYFRVVSRTTIKGDCLAAYQEQKLALLEVLRKTNSRVSLTADMWSSNQNLGYMCITCHFIDNEWNMQKRIIRFTQVRTPHDSIALFNEIIKCIQDWQIESKLFSITVDNASTNDSMVVELKGNLLGKLAMPCKGELFHFWCAAHIFNPIVQDGLSTISAAISRIRESVKYVRASEAREQKFEEIIAQVGIVEEKRPSLDVSTRWNSTYLMLSSSLLFRRAFDSLDRFDPNFKDAPQFFDWENAEVLCKHLKVFYDATVVVSGTSYPTVTRYFHEFWKVKVMILNESNNEDDLVASLVSKMDTKFQKYWDLQFLQIWVPVIFDPRFKLKFLEFRLKAGFGDKATGPNGYLPRIKRTVRTWFAEYSSQICGPSTTNSQEASTSGVNVGGSQFAD